MSDEDRGTTDEVKVVTGIRQAESGKVTLLISWKTLVFDAEGKLIEVKPAPDEELEITGIPPTNIAF